MTEVMILHLLAVLKSDSFVADRLRLSLPINKVDHQPIFRFEFFFYVARWDLTTAFSVMFLAPNTVIGPA